MESLKEAQKIYTNSARIWKELSKLDNIGQHSPANREFKSNKEFREAIVNWHNHIKPESKAKDAKES